MQFWGLRLEPDSTARRREVELRLALEAAHERHLEAQLDNLRAKLEKGHQEHVEALQQSHIELTRAARAEADRAVRYEQLQRSAAQRGLVPYVRSLEKFDRWLMTRPEMRDQLEATLRELGLWEIRVGYDPGQDLSVSVVSPKRH
jgi:hypothetical protein